MDDIKVGEYVKTIDGKIVKILGSEYEDYGERGNIIYLVDKEIWDGTDGFNEYSEWILPDQIKKHSFNIIDLVQYGDYGIMSYRGMIFKKIIGKDDLLELQLKNYKLLKIATKEQMEDILYQVGE